MGFWIYFGLYTFSMVIIWAFFIIAKIHSLKFKTYQPKIMKITHFVNLVMFFLTILGYIFIFINYSNSDTYSLENRLETKGQIENSISNFSDISKEKEIIRNDTGDDYY